MALYNYYCDYWLLHLHNCYLSSPAVDAIFFWSLEEHSCFGFDDQLGYDVVDTLKAIDQCYFDERIDPVFDGSCLYISVESLVSFIMLH